MRLAGGGAQGGLTDPDQSLSGCVVVGDFGGEAAEALPRAPR